MTPSWELVQPSLALVRKNYEAILIIVLLPALLSEYGALVYSGKKPIAIIIIAVALVWRLLNVPVSYYLQLRAASGKVPTIAECYRRGLPFWLRIVGFEILFVIMLIIGFVLLIVPGLVVLRRYYLTPYYIINKDLPIGAAMKMSARETKPVSGWVWGMFGVMLVFIFLQATISSIKFIGPIIAVLISLIYLFGPALRWQEVSRNR